MAKKIEQFIFKGDIVIINYNNGRIKIVNNKRKNKNVDTRLSKKIF